MCDSLLGHRPLVEYAPGLREADIALTEIANKKLTFESTFGQDGAAEALRGSFRSPASTFDRVRSRLADAHPAAAAAEPTA